MNEPVSTPSLLTVTAPAPRRAPEEPAEGFEDRLVEAAGSGGSAAEASTETRSAEVNEERDRPSTADEYADDSRASAESPAASEEAPVVEGDESTLEEASLEAVTVATPGVEAESSEPIATELDLLPEESTVDAEGSEDLTNEIEEESAERLPTTTQAPGESDSNTAEPSATETDGRALEPTSGDAGIEAERRSDASQDPVEHGSPASSGPNQDSATQPLTVDEPATRAAAGSVVEPAVATAKPSGASQAVAEPEGESREAALERPVTGPAPVEAPAAGERPAAPTTPAAEPAPPVEPVAGAVSAAGRDTPSVGEADRSSRPETRSQPVDAARFVSRVSRAFEAAQDRGGGPIQIRLSPPELGSLSVRLEVKDGVLTASLETETQAARNVLLDNLPALRERLAEQQIRVEQFDVDVRDDGRSQAEDRGAESRADRREAQEEESGGREDRSPTPRSADASSADESPRTSTISFDNDRVDLVA